MKLINADEMLMACHPSISNKSKEIFAYQLGWNNALEATYENAPTVDAVQIVRCKNCTYFLHDGSDCFCENMEIFGHEKSVSPDWFCADGSAKVGVI